MSALPNTKAQRRPSSDEGLLFNAATDEGYLWWLNQKETFYDRDPDSLAYDSVPNRELLDEEFLFTQQEGEGL